jgi:hypothetical protein
MKKPTIKIKQSVVEKDRPIAEVGAATVKVISQVLAPKSN